MQLGQCDDSHITSLFCGGGDRGLYRLQAADKKRTLQMIERTASNPSCDLRAGPGASAAPT